MKIDYLMNFLFVPFYYEVDSPLNCSTFVSTFRFLPPATLLTSKNTIWCSSSNNSNTLKKLKPLFEFEHMELFQEYREKCYDRKTYENKPIVPPNAATLFLEIEFKDTNWDFIFEKKTNYTGRQSRSWALARCWCRPSFCNRHSTRRASCPGRSTLDSSLECQQALHWTPDHRSCWSTSWLADRSGGASRADTRARETSKWSSQKTANLDYTPMGYRKYKTFEKKKQK